LIGTFLCFFKLQENFLFSAEQGAEYLAIRKAIVNKKAASFGFQKTIVEKTLAMSKKKEKVNLERIGYLIIRKRITLKVISIFFWLLGNKPSEEKTRLKYTIYEDPKRPQENIGEKEKKFLNLAKYLF